MTVVIADGIAPEHRVGHDPELCRRNAERLQRAAAALAMRDDPTEASEESLPRPGLGGGSAWQEVMGGEDERSACAQQPRIDLRRGDPLEVNDVTARACETRQREGVLDRLDDHPGAWVPNVGRQAVETVVDHVAVCRGDVAVSKP